MCPYYQSDGSEVIRSSGMGSGRSSPPFLHSFYIHYVQGAMLGLGNTKMIRHNLES